MSNHAANHVFVVDNAQHEGGHPVVLPPMGTAGDPPLTVFDAPASTRVSCWLPLNNSHRGSPKVVVDLDSVPSRVNVPSVSPEAAPGEELTIDLRWALPSDNKTSVVLTLLETTGASPTPNKVPSTVTPMQAALRDVGVAVGAAVGTFLIGWGLLSVTVWLTRQRRRRSMDAAATKLVSSQ